MCACVHVCVYVGMWVGGWCGGLTYMHEYTASVRCSGCVYARSPQSPIEGHYDTEEEDFVCVTGEINARCVGRAHNVHEVVAIL